MSLTSLLLGQHNWQQIIFSKLKLRYICEQVLYKKGFLISTDCEFYAEIDIDENTANFVTMKIQLQIQF